ncbi:hypothetical protein AB205_0091770, partial [Aquarana catesbeiana]
QHSSIQPATCCCSWFRTSIPVSSLLSAVVPGSGPAFQYPACYLLLFLVSGPAFQYPACYLLLFLVPVQHSSIQPATCCCSWFQASTPVFCLLTYCCSQLQSAFQSPVVSSVPDSWVLTTPGLLGTHTTPHSCVLCPHSRGPRVGAIGEVTLCTSGSKPIRYVTTSLCHLCLFMFRRERSASPYRHLVAKRRNCITNSLTL